MIYYNGYPEKVEIGIHEMSIDDVEHLILTLNGEDNMHPITRNMLWDNYTKARAQYWDAQFDMGEYEKKRLNELGKRIIAQMEEMYALRDRLLRQELEKIKNGKIGAKSIELETVSDPLRCTISKTCGTLWYSLQWNYAPDHFPAWKQSCN